MTVLRGVRKPAAASPEELLADSAPWQRGLRRPHGGCAGGVCPSVPSRFPGGVHGKTNNQLIGEVWEPLPDEPGKPARIEHEFVRNGVAQIFLEVEPLTGRSHVEGSERRAKGLGTLNRRNAGDALPRGGPGGARLGQPERARHRVAARNLRAPARPSAGGAAEIHYTAKREGWLNIVEIELSTLCGKCLDRRIPSLREMRDEVAAWVTARSQRRTAMNWQFRTEDARIKLKSLYPTLWR